MADPKDYKKLDLPKAQLVKIAEALLAEFKTLKDAGHHVAAAYMAGYAVEALLKAAICTRLDTPNLPSIFKFHNLDVLLFFTGLEATMQAKFSIMDQNFKELCALWKNALLRYEDPTSPNFTATTCNTVDEWLNTGSEAIVPWLKGYI